MSFAQIPNNGFEAWTNTGSYQTPDNWDNLNQVTYNTNIYTCVKGAPGYSGSSYLFLNSKTVPGKGVVPGVAVSGKIDTVTFKPKSGFPFALRPQYLSYYMQYMPADPVDSSSVKVLLTKWNQPLSKRDTVAFGASYFNAMAHSWFNNSTYLNYMNGDNPDSAVIVISSSSTIPKNGSYIYIDEMEFKGNVVGLNENHDSGNLSIYPNPSNGFVTIDFPDVYSANVLVTAYDFESKLIFEKNFQNSSVNIDTSDWRKGLYCIQFKNENNFITKKLIIN